jgi:hypothetical protein
MFAEKFFTKGFIMLQLNQFFKTPEKSSYYDLSKWEFVKRVCFLAKNCVRTIRLIEPTNLNDKWIRKECIMYAHRSFFDAFATEFEDGGYIDDGDYIVWIEYNFDDFVKKCINYFPHLTVTRRLGLTYFFLLPVNIMVEFNEFSCPYPEFNFYYKEEIEVRLSELLQK